MQRNLKELSSRKRWAFPGKETWGAFLPPGVASCTGHPHRQCGFEPCLTGSHTGYLVKLQQQGSPVWEKLVAHLPALSCSVPRSTGECAEGGEEGMGADRDFFLRPLRPLLSAGQNSVRKTWQARTKKWNHRLIALMNIDVKPLRKLAN